VALLGFGGREETPIMGMLPRERREEQRQRATGYDLSPVGRWLQP